MGKSDTILGCMKRMYVVLGIILLVFITAITGMCQMMTPKPVPDQTFDRMKRRMELREEMHRRMRNKLLHGIGPDQDLFKDMDQLFEDVMSDPFDGMNSFTTTATSHYQSEWTESSSGRTLVITPKKDGPPLDINVANGTITIKVKAEQKTANGSYVSSFSNLFSVPQDCDDTKVKIHQQGDKILVEFPFRTTKSITVPPKEERKPLPPSGEEVTI